MMRQLPHTDVKYCMAFSFVEDISFWTFASHQSDCHWPELKKKAQDFTSSLHLLSLMAGRIFLHAHNVFIPQEFLKAWMHT